MKLFRKRALVALSIAVGLVAAAAAPALASNVLLWPSSAWAVSVSGPAGYNQNNGYVNAFGDGSANRLQQEISAFKGQASDNSDQASCTEVWVDWYLNNHRPANVIINCRTDENYYAGFTTLNWPRSDPAGLQGTVVPFSAQSTSANGMKIDVCKVVVDGTSTQWMNRSRGTGGNCADGPTGSIGGITNLNYNHMAYGGVNGIDQWWGTGYPGHSVGGNDMMPQYMYGQIDVMGAGENLNPGGLLLTWDGFYRGVMQHDGNFVIYDSTNAVVWATSQCLKPGESLVAGSRLAVQSDGNIVLYSPSNHAVWASNNYTTCRQGTFTTGGTVQLKLWDASLTETISGSQTWFAP